MSLHNPVGVIYLRRASQFQEDGFGLGDLIKRLQLEAQRDGIQIVDVYEDLGVSGRSQLENRPGLVALLQDARKGKFDVLYISALDRFGRGIRDIFDVVVQLQAFGIKIKVNGEDVWPIEPEEVELMDSLQQLLIRDSDE